MDPTPPRLSVRAARSALVVVTVVGALGRVAGLDAESLWHDELWTYDLATRPFAEIVANRARDGHPPLYFLLARAWVLLFGATPVSLRALSVVPGTLVIPLLYAVAARWRGEVAGLAVAVLAAASSLLVHYAQEARDYAFLFLFATASFAALDRAVERPSRGRLVAWTVLLALTLWSSVFGLVVAATQALWSAGVGLAAARSRPRPTLRGAWPFVVAFATALATFVPWIVVLARRAQDPTQALWVEPPAWGVLPDAFAAFAGTRRGLALMLPLVLLGAWRETRGAGADRRRGALLLAWLLGPVVLPFLLSYVALPVFVQRGTIVGCGAFVLLAALGLEALATRRRLFVAGACALGVALALGVHRHVDRVHREDWRGVAEHLSTHARPGDLVVVADPLEEMGVALYAPGLPVRFAHSRSLGDVPDPWAGSGRVWVARSHHARRMQEVLDRARAAGWRPADSVAVRRISLQRWER
jgi:4-amino-4-deoxy-L-arabinose transferase-like glycosyltransferase